MKLVKTIDILPIPEPRMSRKDRFNPSAAAQRYYDYANELRRLMCQKELPENYLLIFYLPMAKSWSNKKKAAYYLTPHQQQKDKDNLEKAFLDALFSKYSLSGDSKKNDSHVWDGRVVKLWAYEPKIEIYEIDCILHVIGARKLDEF